jgi:alanyl-tRNA synthetase
MGGQVALKSGQGKESAGEYRITEGRVLSMTKHLYYEDSYLSRFQARIQQVVVAGNISEIILDQSAFYPTSGGQPHDRGTVNGRPVVEVSETEKGEILHRIGGIIEGEVADCQIDWDRRFDFMQQHTGQHILSQAFLKLAQANTVGFHLGADYATIDLDCETLPAGLIGQVENLANSIVEENRWVEARIVAAGEVVSLGLRKESKRGGPLRIVEVQGFDVSACGGTHVRNTGEIGTILIRKLERVNRQLRVEFICGGRTRQSYREIVAVLDLSARKFSSAWLELPDRIEKMLEENKELRKKLQEKNRQLAGALARQFYAESV